MKFIIALNQKGFSTVEAMLVLIIVALIGAIGFMVYKNHPKTAAVTNTAKTSTGSNQTKTASGQRQSQKYITIPAWGVRVPYSGFDTLSVSDQTCYENGDAQGDTVSSGCEVTVSSQNLAQSVGDCTAKVSGTVGYFYKMGANDNYGLPAGAGYMPVADWTADHKGQYTKLGSNYYAFAEIGKANGELGAQVADSNDYNGTYTGCNEWQATYNTVEQSVQALASKFETIPK